MNRHPTRTEIAAAVERLRKLEPRNRERGAFAFANSLYPWASNWAVAEMAKVLLLRAGLDLEVP